MASGLGFRTGLGLFLLRLMVGWVFLSEGLQKFLFPGALGAGRFAKIGIPLPHFTAPFVGLIEILCGAMLIFGIATLYAVIPLLIDIGVALATTKWPLVHKEGWWAVMHEGRTDFCMLLGLIAIACLGAGRWSFDRR
ncbi:MAG TPA: DoxX family protein [Terracidiphilus sp.]|jgi:putative oxidoreductase|nr:DoxX family protein [Terracidiphilus sp.]